MSVNKSGPVRALVVDDDPNIRTIVSRVLESAGCEVRVAVDGEQGLVQALEFQPHVVFLDIKMPLQHGWLVCAKLKLVEPSPAVVLMTGLDYNDLDSSAEFAKASDVLRKPFSPHDVLALVPAKNQATAG